MQFGYTILYVPDVPASLAFYQAAFGLNTRFLHDSGDFAELDTGATALAFCSHALLHAMGKSPRAPQADHPSFEIALVTDDVPAAVARAQAAGAQLVQAPTDMPWGQTIAYVRDLNGFLVELCTPVSPPTSA